MNNSVIVSLRDIVVDFDGQRILDGLNLDIHDKEFVTLLGPSGCGKTTTLRLIAGFLEPTSGKVLLKMEDNITTDHIAPSDAKLLPFRSNVPYLSDFCLTPVDATFPARAKKEGGGILVAGMNYGQRVEPRTRRACPAVSGHPRRRRQVVRPHSSGEPYQQRHSSADVPERGGLRPHRAGRHAERNRKHHRLRLCRYADG